MKGLARQIDSEIKDNAWKMCFTHFTQPCGFPFTAYISTQTKLWELDTRNFILAATKDTP